MPPWPIGKDCKWRAIPPAHASPPQVPVIASGVGQRAQGGLAQHVRSAVPGVAEP